MTTHQINLEFYWPAAKSSSEQLEDKVKLNLSRHPEWNTTQKLARVLWCLGDEDFCIFSYKSELNYLQFCRRSRNLIMSFPYSVKWPTRFRQVDRVGLILKSHGFGPNLALGAKSLKSEDFMLMQDTYNDKFAELQAYFGFDHELFAAGIVVEIAQQVWLAGPDLFPTVTLGSWKK